MLVPALGTFIALARVAAEGRGPRGCIGAHSAGHNDTASQILGLIPVMWATGTGADVVKRLAAPMVAVVVSAMLLALVVIPSLYMIWA